MTLSTPPPFHTDHKGAGSLVLIGGGGHAVVVAEAAALAGPSAMGFLDDNPSATLATLRIDVPHPYAMPAWLGALADLQQVKGKAWIIALGDVAHRRSVLDRLDSLGVIHSRTGKAQSVIHPSAIVSPTAAIGPGVYIGPGAIVHARARIEGHAIINSGAIVEHDCVIEENVHVAPGAVLGGAVHVGRDTLVGLGCRVLPGIKIGTGCTIGAAAAVVTNIRDGATIIGVPGREKKA